MGQIALRVECLSKRYSIGRPSSVQIRQPLVTFLRRGKRALLGQPPPPASTVRDAGQFWALKDVSFEVTHGERVGIIGRNGAGKSTLLKILSRITKPTEGHADVYGRLGSLLEVGTGFHPELTGRDNIYLNATILGLRSTEVARRFDEIVAFAEIEKFIDMPVKHYSSGMFMRLAFSVSAHLDPDILVLDEVLAVGDAAFQKRCLGKMEGVAKSGRTVLLVSHSVPTIVSFCDRCLLLDEGRLMRDGDAAEVTGFYQESLTANSEKAPDVIRAERAKTNKARFTSIRLTPLGDDGAPRSVLRVGQDMEVEVTICATERINDVNVAIIVLDLSGYRLIDANIALKNDYLTLDAGQEAVVRFTLRTILLRPDSYRIALWLGRRPVEDIDLVTDAATFTIEVDPRKTTHFQVYPAVYQCEFTHSKVIGEARGDPVPLATRN